MHMIFNNMATQGGSMMRVSSFPSSPSSFNGHASRAPYSTISMHTKQMVRKGVTWRRCITCSALRESSASTSTSTSTVAAETKGVEAVETKAPAKPKPPAKAPTKPLPQLMEEDVIPPLKAILEAQDDIAELDLSFQDNRLEGSFVKKGKPYSFWAFFPNGVLTGPKGFALSSCGSEASTVEPFLIDEKKITGKHIIFWVRKRLAAQGIIPVWED